MKYLFAADGLAAAALAGAVRAFATRHSLKVAPCLIWAAAPAVSLDFYRAWRALMEHDIDHPDLLIGADGTVPIADESVDFVVSFQVLEHVRDVRAYLAAAARVLRPDGRVFLSHARRLALPSASHGLLALDSRWPACAVFEETELEIQP